MWGTDRENSCPLLVQGGLSELGVGVAIGLGFGFEGKPLDKATRKAARLLPDTRCGRGVGEVIV